MKHSTSELRVLVLTVLYSLANKFASSLILTNYNFDTKLSQDNAKTKIK